MQDLTLFEGKILDEIEGFWNSNGYAPSMQDIANACYCSKATASNYIWRLVDKEYLHITPNVPRSIHRR